MRLSTGLEFIRAHTRTRCNAGRQCFTPPEPSCSARAEAAPHTRAARSDCQFDKLRVDVAPPDDESGHRYGQLEAPGPSATRVQEQYTVPLGHGRLVGMAAD